MMHNVVKQLVFGGIVVACGLSGCARTSAQTVGQDFEAVSGNYFRALPVGVAQEGSTVAISKAQSHSGTQSAHLSYRFSKRGYITLNTEFPPLVVQEGNVLHLSVWIHGSGQNDFPGGGGLLLLDGGNETFQYWLGKPFGDALRRSEWNLFTADIDLTKPAGHWGGKDKGTVQMPLRFLGFGLDHNPDVATQGETFFDDLSLVGEKQPLSQTTTPFKPARLVITKEPNDPAFTLLGKPVRVQVHVPDFPTDKESGTAVLDWRAVDFHGTDVAHGREALSKAGDAHFLVAPNAPGVVYIKASVLNKKGTVVAQGDTQIATYAARASSPAVAEKPLPLLFGVCTHLTSLSAADAEREVKWMKAIGFRACRFDCDWNTIEPEKGVWKWGTYDRIFALMKKYGIEPLPILAYSTQWAATGDQNATDWHVWANSPPNTNDFANFARECVRRYGGNVRYWEVWNEPDNEFWRGTPEQYAQLFDAVYVAIKKVSPTASVINGGVSEVRRPPDFVPKWQAAAHFPPDIFAYHSHAPLTGMLEASAFVRADLKAAHWGMPVWNNEAGFSSNGSRTERDQAIALAKKMSYSPALGDSAYYWYDLHNDGPDLHENEHNFGLLQNDYSPKASAVAARTVIDSLNGHRFIRRIAFKETPQVFALLYGSPDGKSGVVSLWNEGSDAVPLLWSVPGKASQTFLMGSAKLPSPVGRTGGTDSERGATIYPFHGGSEVVQDRLIAASTADSDCHRAE